jgi:hypothetical protein
VIELDAAHDPADGHALAGAASAAGGGDDREAVDGDGGHVDAHADGGEEAIRARPQRTGADLLAGVTLSLDDDDAVPPVRRGRREKERGGDPRGTAADDDEIEIGDVDQP